MSCMFNYALVTNQLGCSLHAGCVMESPGGKGPEASQFYPLPYTCIEQLKLLCE